MQAPLPHYCLQRVESDLVGQFGRLFNIPNREVRQLAGFKRAVRPLQS